MSLLDPPADKPDKSRAMAFTIAALAVVADPAAPDRKRAVVVARVDDAEVPFAAERTFHEPAASPQDSVNLSYGNTPL